MTIDSRHRRRMSRELGDGDLRPYLPGAVAKILMSICTFEDVPLELNPPMIERIAHMYFTHTDDRGDEIAVAATARRRVTMPSGSLFKGDEVRQPGDVNAHAGDWTDAAAKAVAAMRSAEEGLPSYEPSGSNPAPTPAATPAAEPTPPPSWAISEPSGERRPI